MSYFAFFLMCQSGIQHLFDIAITSPFEPAMCSMFRYHVCLAVQALASSSVNSLCCMVPQGTPTQLP